MVEKTSTKISKIEAVFAAGTLLVITAVVVLSLASLGKLKTEYSVSQFLPPSHPLMQADEELRKKYLLDVMQPVLVTLELENGDWLETKRLEQLAKATSAVAAVKGIQGAFSLGTIETAIQTPEELQLGTLSLIEDESERRERVRNDRFLSPLLVSEDARRALMVLSQEREFSNEELTSLVGEVRESLKANLPSDVKFLVGGVPAIQAKFVTLVESELVRFMALSLIISCLALLFVFSSWSSLLIPLVAILSSNALVLGFMVLAGLSMSVLAVTLPILISVVVLALCIHVMLRYVEDENAVQVLQLVSFKTSWVLTTVRHLAFPTFLISVIAACGFMTLAVTDVPLIRDFGLSVAVAMVLSWFATFMVIVPLLLLLPVPKVRKLVAEEAQWSRWIFKFSRPIVAVTIVGCISLASLSWNLPWSARLFDDLPKNDEARIATEEIDRDLGGTIPLEINVDLSTQEAWSEPTALHTLDQLIARMREIPGVGSVTGLTDLLRLSLGDPQADIPESRTAIAESWFLIGVSGGGMLDKFLASEGSATRIGLRLRDIEADEMEALAARLVNMTKEAFPGAKVQIGGMAATIHNLNNELSRALMVGYWHALGVITIFLLIVFRSWRWTLVALLPNLVPAAVLVGVLSLAQTPIKPGVAIVFSIALGLAFNNTVYLLQRLRSLMNEKGTTAGREIERTLRLEGNPCMVATLSLLTGFAVFLVSEFGVNQTFGVYMLISLFFGLVGDIAFLPAFVKVFPEFLVSTGKALQANLASVHPTEEEMLLESELSSREKSLLPRTAAGLITFFIAFSPVTPASAAPEANTILKKVEQNLNAKDERALIKMKVIESNGSSKERELEIKRKSGKKHQVLVRLRAPSDVSGVAFLSVMDGSREDQWLYMPSQKKARRVVSGNKSQRFLDTEFNLEDFSAATYAGFENKVVKEERAPSATVAVIESKAKNSSDSSYSKILTWVDLNSYQVQKSEYYDRDGKLLKTMVFRDYKKYGSAWRARTIEVRNMQNQRSTVLNVAALKVNAGLSDREFTQGALERGD